MSNVGISGGVKNWENTRITEKELKELKNATNENKFTGEDKENSKGVLTQARDSFSKGVASGVGKAKSFISMGCIPDMPDIFKHKFENPKDVIENIRNSNGVSRDESLVRFQGKLDNMGEKELTIARDYLVNVMADPNNKDDELLGVLLNAVNKELDSRDYPIMEKWPRPILCTTPPSPVPPSWKNFQYDKEMNMIKSPEIKF